MTTEIDKIRAIISRSSIRVLVLLESYGQLTVNQISHMLCIEQSKLSHNLKILRRNGIVETERSGQMIFYRIADMELWLMIKTIIKYLKSKQNGKKTKTKVSRRAR